MGLFGLDLRKLQNISHIEKNQLFFEISKNVSSGGSVWGPVTQKVYAKLQHKFYNTFPICSFRPVDKQSAVLC